MSWSFLWPRRRPCLATLVLPTAGAAALILALAPAALGHAVLEASDPDDGTTLEKPPALISLHFSEPVSTAGGSFELVSIDGQRIPLQARSSTEADATTVILDVPLLEQDLYRLRWSVLSSDDLHVTRGTLVFGIGVPAQVSTAEDAITSPAEVAVRWLDLLAFTMLVGAMSLLLAGLPRAWGMAGDGGVGDAEAGAVARARGRLLRLAVVSAIAALTFGAARLAVLAAGAGAANPAGIGAIVTGSTFGGLWLAREAALITALVGLIAAFRGQHPGQGAALAAGVCVFAAATFQAATGHLVARIGAPLAVPVGVVHLVAAGVWVGGVLALAVAVVPAVREGDVGRRYARRVLARFGRLAAVALVGLVISGTFLAGQLVATPDALVGSAYGAALLAKAILVAGVAVLGLLNAAAVHPSIGRLIGRGVPLGTGARFGGHDLRHSVRAEALGGLAILGLAAFIASTPPARGPAWDPIRPDAVTSAVAGVAADLLVTVDVRPNRPGRNFVSIGVIDTRRPALAPVERVTVRLTDPDGSAVEPSVAALGAGRFEATPRLAGTGDWRVQVTIVRPGLADAVFETPWTLVAAGAPRSGRQVVISDATLEPILTSLAAAIGVLGLAVAAALVIYARRRRARATARRHDGLVPLGRAETTT